MERDVNMKRHLIEDLKTRLKTYQENERPSKEMLESLERKVIHSVYLFPEPIIHKITLECGAAHRICSIIIPWRPNNIFPRQPLT